MTAPSFQPRPAQQDILSYQKGTMGVSAVPGSGKTWTLSLLAAEIIRNNYLEPGQEVLVVTLVNSAVDNFTQRISRFLNAYGLIPSLGYRVRTLHGLAHDIVLERPELAGLDNGFQIIDERESIRIREDAVSSWLRGHPGGLDSYLLTDLSEKKVADLYQRQIPDLLNQIAFQFIRSAKNLQLSPSALEELCLSANRPLPLVQFGLEIYKDYQKNLSFRGAVDFDDLITSAHQVISLDTSLLERLQRQWPYVLEDEAQDSSLLQQKILTLLTSKDVNQNWVRVGDPNQAIYESFTTADPRLLERFIQEADACFNLPNSGRSSLEIIDLANYLVRWCNAEHPVPAARDALYPNQILPTPPGDSQPNPTSQPGAIVFYQKEQDPDEEINLIAASVDKWIRENPQATAAVLAPRNERGKKLAGVLRDSYQVEPVELLSSSLATRKTTGALVKVMTCLIHPGSSSFLAEAYRAANRDSQMDEERWSAVEKNADLLRSLEKPELFLAPGGEKGWLQSLAGLGFESQSSLAGFRELVLNWHQASLLPVDQLVLTIAIDLFHDPAELNLAHQIAYFLRQLSISHPDWELPTLLDELRAFARNERRFFTGSEGVHFDPDAHRGKIVITTAHKAKGLEWDRVYLIAANDYNFPSGLPEDRFISEKWFIRDSLNLPAETLAQLEFISQKGSAFPKEGVASLSARLEYSRERLRLFYVSLTRARRELIVTWNNGRNGRSTPSLAFRALSEHLSNLNTSKVIADDE